MLQQQYGNTRGQTEPSSWVKTATWFLREWGKQKHHESCKYGTSTGFQRKRSMSWRREKTHLRVITNSAKLIERKPETFVSLLGNRTVVRITIDFGFQIQIFHYVAFGCYYHCSFPALHASTIRTLYSSTLRLLFAFCQNRGQYHTLSSRAQKVQAALLPLYLAHPRQRFLIMYVYVSTCTPFVA